MPALYVFFAMQPQKLQYNHSFRTFLEQMEQCLRENQIALTYHLPQNTSEILAFGIRAVDTEESWCGGRICYTAEHIQSARLANQIAAQLQESCERFVESAPMQRPNRRNGIPTILLELHTPYAWFLESMHSLARTVAQAICMYFAQPAEKKSPQQARVEASSVSIRTEPTKTAPEICKVCEGEQLQVQENLPEWLQVQYGAEKGYIQKDFITLCYPE